MNLQITVTFINGTYHGRSDNELPEWPPSPLRLFQALVATASRSNIDANDALDWLAGLPAPVIFAPLVKVGRPYQTSVPNNAMDIVARSWSRGQYSSKDSQPSTHKAMKTIRPSYLLKVADSAPGSGVIAEPLRGLTETESERRVTYCWQIDSDRETKFPEQIARVAQQLSSVGWGVDLVAGHGESNGVTPNDSRERWIPITNGRMTLRSPRPMTRKFLADRHERFLNRIADETLRPVPALPAAAFQKTGYGTGHDHVPFPFAAFSLLKPDGSGFRPFRETKGCEVAGMVRHCARIAAENAGWTADVVAQFILGHGDARRDSIHKSVGLNRFGYVPLPSLEVRQKGNSANNIGMIRRVLLFTPDRAERPRLQWARQAMSGQLLVSEGSKEDVALISAIPDSDATVQRYVRGSRKMQGAMTWATVTPLILPGRDDNRDKKTDGLIRKAIIQAGFSDAMAKNAAVDWSKACFFPGGEHASRYFVPGHLRDYPRYHVRITWRTSAGVPTPVAGPIVIGGGRYSGLGLFAAE